MPDKQSTRSLGRDYLLSQLEAGRIDVSLRAHFPGAHLRASISAQREISCPIRFYSTKDPVFRVDYQSGQSANLLLAYIWNVSSDDPVVYAVPYLEAVKLLEHPDHKDHTMTRSWKSQGAYSTKANATWHRLLSRYRMRPKDWVPKILSMSNFSLTTADTKD